MNSQPVIVRSWPDVIRLPQRGHVVDDLPRLLVNGYDYREPLVTLWKRFSDREGVIILEWDIAVELGELERFVKQTMKEPGRVLVAPYMLYSNSTGKYESVIAHRHFVNSVVKYIDVYEPQCDLFAFGMVYLPWATILDFDEDTPKSMPLNDDTFSHFHHTTYNYRPLVMWGVSPVHLNYRVPNEC